MTEVVYVIGTSRSERVKIGRSGTVSTRLAGIQRMSPVPLQIQWQTDGGSELEAALHRHFKDERIHGEWFDFGDRDAVAEVELAVEIIRAEAVAAELADRQRRERPEPRNYGEALARLDEATAKVNRLRAALAEAEADAKKEVARSLRSCIAEGQNRTEVQKHSPFSPPTVRDIGEDAGIPPDERYVRKSQTPQAPTTSGQPMRPLTRADELRAIAGDLSDLNALRIADELSVKHGRMLTVGKTSRETIDNAIRANLVTASDLR